MNNNIGSLGCPVPQMALLDYSLVKSALQQHLSNRSFFNTRTAVRDLNTWAFILGYWDISL